MDGTRKRGKNERWMEDKRMRGGIKVAHKKMFFSPGQAEWPRRSGKCMMKLFFKFLNEKTPKMIENENEKLE